MKRLIIRASIVVAIAFIPLIAMAQDNWGPASEADSLWYGYECHLNILSGFSSPAVSSNDSLIFVNFRNYDGHRIAYSVFRDGVWQCPIQLPSSIQTLGITDPFLYDAGDTIIYFSSGLSGGQGGLDLWAIRLNNGEWSVPWNLGSQINSTGHESSPSMTRDGTKMYFARNDTVMYSEIINGEFATAIELPDVINGSANWSPDPKISPDGLRLYFSQGGAPYNPAPLVVSSLVNGVWQEPIHLNENINFSIENTGCEYSESRSYAPSFSLNGLKMYFTHFEVVGMWCEAGYGFYVSELMTGINDENLQTPSNFSLSAYPNPFNAQTRIVYVGDISELKGIAIYSITGQKVKSFAPAAEILWDGADMRGNGAASGLYFVVANGVDHRAVTKVTLLR